MENCEDSLIILIIESKVCPENAHEIMAVDGIDGATAAAWISLWTSGFSIDEMQVTIRQL